MAELYINGEFVGHCTCSIDTTDQPAFSGHDSFVDMLLGKPEKRQYVDGSKAKVYFRDEVLRA